MFSNRLGFTLIECLIAMTMMVVVSFSVSYMNYSSKMDKKTTDTSLNCNQIIQNTMNQISSIGRKLNYEEVYESTGALKTSPIRVVNGDDLYNSAFIKNDIVNLLRRETSLFSSSFRCGVIDLSGLSIPDGIGSSTNLFDGMDQHVLEDLCIKIEREVWNIDKDEDHNMVCGTVNSDEVCGGPCCPRPKALCKVQPTDSTCETTLDPGDSNSKINVKGRSDIGYKVKLSLVVLCDRNDPDDPRDCQDPENKENIKMQCNMDRVFSYAPDIIPIKFDKNPDQNLRITLDEEGPYTPPKVEPYQIEILTNPPTINQEDKKYVHGSSYLFRNNIHNNSNKCGEITRHGNSTHTRTFKATFKLAEPTEEFPATVFYCKVDYMTFNVDPTDLTKVINAGALSPGDWAPCDKIPPTPVGAIKEIKIEKPTTNDNFTVKFSYDPRIDADHRIHLVAVDPAGNASEIKRISFASKNCKDDYIRPQDPYLESINCAPDQWCKLIPRNPWRGLQDIPDPMNGSVNIYDHRKDDSTSTCRYYKIVESQCINPHTKWNCFGCFKASCCPNPGSSCLNCINPDPNCYDEHCSLGECNNYLDNTHRKVNCDKPSPGNCSSSDPSSCSCTPKTNPPPTCVF